MRTVVILFCVALAGCATSQPHASSPLTVVRSNPTQSVADRATVAESTRYELGSYRYPSSRNDNETTIVRVTRVPVGADNARLSLAISPSYDPLPRSAELSVELATQRDITERIRSIQADMMAAEQKAKEQYGILVSESQSVAKLRIQLETERNRLRELESRASAGAPALEAPTSISTPASTSTEVVKW